MINASYSNEAIYSQATHHTIIISISIDGTIEMQN